MRVGLFTDTYRPSINGIVYVIESLKTHLEDAGHEVFVFCPARSINPGRQAKRFDEDDHVIRFPSIKGAFYDDYDTSLFFPPRVLAQIRELDLDIIHFVTPGQVGMMGVYAAYKTDTPLVAQHCTDLREYVEHYRDGSLLPGVLALAALIPFAVKVNGKDIREIMRIYRPRRERVQWNIDVVEHMITLIYSKTDAVIALSRKSQHQLESWQDKGDYHYPVTMMPNGVDRISPPRKSDVAAFRRQWNIAEGDEVIGFVGRLGAEKNLAMLIPTLEKVAKKRPKARLLFVGDFDFRETLEQMANVSLYADRVTFTGTWPRENLGVVYGAMDVFVFPSLTDTQGWVLHEAAFAGRPIVLIDQEVSEVVVDGVNGVYVQNSSTSMAKALVDLLSQPKKRAKYGREGQKLARQFTETRQVSKLIKLYERIIADREEI